VPALTTALKKFAKTQKLEDLFEFENDYNEFESEENITISNLN
jgi:hypothetical protein